MALIKILSRKIKLLFEKIIYFVFFIIPIKFHLLNSNNAVFFCGNSTIGDNAIMLSLAAAFYSTHRCKKIKYYAKKSYILKLRSLYVHYQFIVWKPICNSFFEKILKKNIFLKKTINFFNRHQNRTFHSVFYLQERIPDGSNIIEYQAKKMKIADLHYLGHPSFSRSDTKNYVFLNIESQTVKLKNLFGFANSLVKHCNEKGIKVLVNSKEKILDGEYDLVYCDLPTTLQLINSSRLFVSVRAGIIDLAISCNTNILAVYSDKIDNIFSLKMWPKTNCCIIKEITEKQFCNEIIDEFLYEKNNF